MNEHSYLHKLAETNQSAYRRKHSTATTLLKIFNDVLLEHDKRNVVFLTLLYLSTAFDTVDYNILLNRLCNTYGYSGMALQWFTSHLSQRKQRVLINGALSSERTLNWSLKDLDLLVPFSIATTRDQLANLLK